MAALAPIQRFYQPGTTKIVYVETMADYTAPTLVELAAGTNIEGHVRAIDGWEVSSDTIETPDFATTFTGKIGGRTSADDSSLTCYAAKDAADIRSVVSRGDTGFMVLQYGGTGTGAVMDVFPVQAISLPKQNSDSEAFAIMVQFVITSEPAEDIAIPTA